MKLPAIKLARPLVILALTAGLLGAGTAAVAAPVTPDVGYLRLAHLSPNTPPVDVYLYSFGHARAMVVLKHVGYGTVSPYETVAGGEYTVAMRGAGAAPSSKPVLSATINIAPGSAYTVAGMGPNAGLRLQVIRDRLTAPADRALVRVIQASLRQHQVTVRVGGRALSRDQAFATVSSYHSLSPGTWTVRATGAGEHATATIPLAADGIYTLVVLDRGNHLAITALPDAAGSSRAPIGGAATGLGGTAPQPAPSQVPWLVTIAGGLLLILGGIARIRRTAVRIR